MYVCLCHAITDREIYSQRAKGDCSVSDIYKAKGCKPSCGKCVATVCGILKNKIASPLALGSVAASFNAFVAQPLGAGPLSSVAAAS